MVAKVVSLDAARARKPCRRADGSLPGTAVDPTRPGSRLERALRAVAAMGPAAFEKKLAVFNAVWRTGQMPAKSGDGSPLSCGR